jgi:DNA-directed RNA polymerase specialized sigma24 family protein
MNPALKVALAQPDWNATFAKAVLHADTRIRKFIWRGFRPTSSGRNEIAVGDKSAKDFVQEAVKRLITDKRAYDASRTLLANLNSITDSLIWSEKKSSDRTGLVDYAETNADDGDLIDPISNAQDSQLSADEKLKHDELIEDQRRCFKDIRASFDGDDSMQEYLDALSQGIFKRADISEVTGLDVIVIDELRRKLAKYAPRFFGVNNVEELQRLLHEGES